MEQRFIPAVVTRIAPSLMTMVRAAPFIDYIEPVVTGTYLAQSTPWNITRVRAPGAWVSGTGGGVKLLIIDSGVDGSHPDLNPAVIQACDSTDGLDEFGHGTHVSGIATAVNNASYVVGVAHGVALWSSKVGTTVPNAAFVECAIEFGRLNQTFVMSMSLSLAPLTSLTDDQGCICRRPISR
jgi:subtilisin/minor extracellular protease Epr